MNKIYTLKCMKMIQYGFHKIKPRGWRLIFLLRDRQTINDANNCWKSTSKYWPWIYMCNLALIPTWRILKQWDFDQSGQYHVDSGFGSLQNDIKDKDYSVSGGGDCETLAWEHYVQPANCILDRWGNDSVNQDPYRLNLTLTWPN